MDWRNRFGLYGSYFLGMAAIGFTLPYLPLYLGEKGLSDRAIGIVSTLAGLAQFPVGLWSDRVGWRKEAISHRRTGGDSRVNGASARCPECRLARVSGDPVR
jgi:MFS family permease